MYESFYGLQRDPFRLRPDPAFAFRHESYARARNDLEYGLFRGEGLVLVTGAPGSGKSTLVEDLLAQHGDLKVARVVGTQTNVDGFVRLVAFALGGSPGADRASCLIEIQRCLHECAQHGRRVLLVVDNAQDLPRESVEELRVLGRGDNDAGLQVLLLGQNDLNALVSGDHLEDLRQRIIASCDLEALSPETTRDYIRHRLEVAGWSGVPELSEAAHELIHHYTGGNPRRINMLCARLLLQGFADDRQSFGAADVRSLVEKLSPGLFEIDESELHAEPEPEPAPQRPAAPPPPAPTERFAAVAFGSAEGILDDGDGSSRWTPPAVPLTFTLEADMSNHHRHRYPRYSGEPRVHARHPPPTGSRSVWLLLALVLAFALGWIAISSGVDRGGSGWQEVQGAINDYVERSLDP